MNRNARTACIDDCGFVTEKLQGCWTESSSKLRLRERARAGDKAQLPTCGTGDGPGSGTPVGEAATQPYCDLDENNLLLGAICSLFISLSLAGLSVSLSLSLNVARSPL